MDKGVLNNHKGQITCTPAKDKDGNAHPDVVLRPGKNRLTEEQYKAIKTNKVVQKYFDVGLLVDAKIPGGEAAADFRDVKKTGDQDNVDALPNMEKMTKAELLQLGKNKFGLDLKESDTNDALRAQILEAAKAKG